MFTLKPWKPFAARWNVIIFHSPCTDGHTAATIAWRTLPDDYRAALAKFGGLYARKSDDCANDNRESTSAKFAEQLLDDGYPVVFVGMSPDEQPSASLIENRRVLYLDRWISRNTSEVATVVKLAEKVKVLDHHSGNAAHIAEMINAGIANVLGGKLECTFSPQLTYSGASLAWYEFNEGSFPPEFVRCVQIQDTWNWEQEPTLPVKDIMLALKTRGYLSSFVNIDECMQLWTDSFRDELVSQGRQISEFVRQEVVGLANTATLARIYVRYEDDAHRLSGSASTSASTSASVSAPTSNNAPVRAMNVLITNTPIHISEVGAAIRDQLAPASKNYEYQGTRIDFTATWKIDAQKDMVYVSLRSPADGIDLARVAGGVLSPAIPGGGHKNAAGFSIKGVANLMMFVNS